MTNNDQERPGFGSGYACAYARPFLIWFGVWF